MMTKEQAVAIFNETYMPIIREAEGGRKDRIMRTEEWHNFTDMLCRDGEISLRQYGSWTVPRICE